MSDKDGDAWIKALAGGKGGSAGVSDTDVREAAAVRAYLQRRIAEDGSGADDPQRELRMMNYLRAQGAFRPRQQTAPPNRIARFGTALLSLAGGGSRQRWAWAAGIAVTVLMVPVIVQLAGRPNEVTDVSETQSLYRGNVAVSRIIAADPAATARDIAAALQAEHVPSRARQDGEHWIVEAKVPAEKRAALKERLAAWSLAIPDNGILVVQIAHP